MGVVRLVPRSSPGGDSSAVAVPPISDPALPEFSKSCETGLPETAIRANERQKPRSVKRTSQALSDFALRAGQAAGLLAVCHNPGMTITIHDKSFVIANRLYILEP